MRLTAVLSVFMLLLAACSGNSGIPKGIIQMKPMQQVVWDMMEADETAMQKKYTDSTLDLKKESFRLYDQVFAVHKISRDEFYKSYRYYQQHPSLYKSLLAGAKKISDNERKNSRVK